MKKICVLGVGHNTRVIMELAELNGYCIEGLYNYKINMENEIISGTKVIGTYEELFATNIEGKNFTLSMGNNKIRVELADKIRSKGGIIPTLVHPTASVSKYATIENSVVIQANATIQADTVIKEDTVISFNTGITHNSIIEKGCYIAGQTIVGAYVHIEEMVFVGMGSTIVSAKVPYIGKNAIIGAGSVVVKPVEANAIVKGNPATVYEVNIDDEIKTGDRYKIVTTPLPAMRI